MFQYQDVQFQIVEAPALIEGSAEGEAWGLQTLGLARNADALILMVDLSHNPNQQLSLILNELEKARILVQRPRARVEIQRKYMGAGLRILLLGRLINCTIRDVEELLRDYRISDATVKIHGEATLDDVEDSVFENTTHRPAMIVANKVDVFEAMKNWEGLKSFVGDRIRIVPVSCKTGLA
ncbi:MAG: translation-associated GTPase [Candidatus Bathyarchaeota archaeon BA1]|nr:MAG: translation-associated GTPase [Candidatus Bathyarchaeota archaeon BA1]